MALSMIFGRTGSNAEGTGLYLMEGSSTDMHIVDHDALKVAEGSGIVHSAFQPFKDMDNVFFINKLDNFSYEKHTFLEWMAMTIDMESGDWKDPDAPSLFTSVSNTTLQKTPVKLWTNEVLGLAPPGRAIKVILKHKRVQAARAAVLATGIPPSEGGRTWILSTEGFTKHKGKTPAIVGEGGLVDLNDLQQDNGLFVVVTNAVVFLTGHRRRQPDEKSVRVLEFNFNQEPYEKGMDSFLSSYVTTRDDRVMHEGIEMLKYCAKDFSENGPASVDLFDEDESFLVLEDEEML